MELEEQAPGTETLDTQDYRVLQRDEEHIRLSGLPEKSDGGVFQRLIKITSNPNSACWSVCISLRVDKENDLISSRNTRQQTTTYRATFVEEILGEVPVHFEYTLWDNYQNTLFSMHYRDLSLNQLTALADHPRVSRILLARSSALRNANVVPLPVKWRAPEDAPETTPHTE